MCWLFAYISSALTLIRVLVDSQGALTSLRCPFARTTPNQLAAEQGRHHLFMANGTSTIRLINTIDIIDFKIVFPWTKGITWPV